MGIGTRSATCSSAPPRGGGVPGTSRARRGISSAARSPSNVSTRPRGSSPRPSNGRRSPTGTTACGAPPSRSSPPTSAGGGEHDSPAQGRGHQLAEPVRPDRLRRPSRGCLPVSRQAPPAPPLIESIRYGLGSFRSPTRPTLGGCPVWQRLPSNLRTILGCALVLGIGVTAAAFTLSFFALRAAASNPELQFGAGHEWLFPVALDAGLVFAEVLLLGASMVHGANRAIPVMLVLAFGVGTLYFNITRVPSEVRLITAVPPLASICMTIGLAYLMKLLTTLSGGVQLYHAPPPTQHYLGAQGSPLQGAVWRPDQAPYPAVPSWNYGQMPS